MLDYYIAHIIIVHLTENQTKDLYVHENIIILSSESEDEAVQKASTIGKREAEIDDNLTIDSLPAKRIFAGVRKIVKLARDQNKIVELKSDYLELTYSVYVADTLEEVDKMANGADVGVLYIE